MSSLDPFDMASSMNFTMLDSTYRYATALTGGAAILTVKVALIHLLTRRERCIEESSARAPDNINPLLPIYRFFLLAVDGTGLGGQGFIERGEQEGKNCAESEPYFLLLATVAGMTGSIPAAFGANLITTYVGARVAHTIAYLSEKSDKKPSLLRGPCQTVAWLCAVSMGLTVLGLKPSRNS